MTIVLRRVVKSGKSYLISLPPELVRKLNLEKGDYVLVKVIEVNGKIAKVEIRKET